MSAARFASRIHTDSPQGCRVALLGLPDDLGVRMNGGRPGAALGPPSFRHALSRYGVHDPLGTEFPLVFDAGDVVPSADPKLTSEANLARTHARVHEAASALHALGLFPIAIGGGHDLTLPFVQAAIEAERKRVPSTPPAPPTPFGGIYFDAHLDVRAAAGSGMPFRRLIEDHGVGPISITGLQPLVNSREHVRWFAEHGGLFDGATIDAAGNPVKPANPGPLTAGFLSLDLDVFDQSIAPGVSAMNPSGAMPRDITPRLLRAAASPWVRCFDIMELCPTHDEQGRTARLAAHMFLVFLTGFASGPQAGKVEERRQSKSKAAPQASQSTLDEAVAALLRADPFPK